MKDIKIWGFVVPAVVYALTALTDMLDGKIARKYNLITDFGKFIDPLADKFMVIGAMVCIFFTNAGNLAMFTLYFFALVVVVFRELAVTSIRLIAASSKEKVVIAANMLGKLKTVTQIVAICAAIIEPIIYKALSLDNVQLLGFPPITLVTTVAMIYLTMPIFYPLITALGADAYWFAAIVTFGMMMGSITPPVGMSIYAVAALDKKAGLMTVVKGSMPYLGCMLVMIALIIIFPGLASWLPSIM